MSDYSLTRILSTDGLGANGIEALRDAGMEVVEKKYSKSQLIEELVHFDAVIVRSATTIDGEIIKAVMANPNTKLKVIARGGTGVDNIDVVSATETGLLVINTPAANTLSAAEHTCALLCCLSRQIPQAYMSMQQGKWDRKSFMGTELMNKTLAIIGLGRIGKEVALRAQAFGMTTIGFDPLVQPEEAMKFNVKWLELNEIWPIADYITVHVPLIPQTENLINIKTFDSCKSTVKIINCSRGGIINEDDLLTALKSGKCGGAALDVFTEEPPTCTELIKHPNVISTPHLGASTVEAQYRVSMEIAENLLSLSQSKSLSGLINGHSIEISSMNEMQGWKKILESVKPILNDMTEIKLRYTSNIRFCSNRAFETFVKNYLAMIIVSNQMHAGQNINLINSHIFAKINGINISIEKVIRCNSAELPSLILEVKGQPIEVMLMNDRLFLTGYNNLNLNQPILLEGPGNLTITSDVKEAGKFLTSLIANNDLISYVIQEEHKLFIFVHGTQTHLLSGDVQLSIKF